MIDKTSFELSLSKRYFHLIAFKAETKYTITSFWKDCEVNLKTEKIFFENSQFTISQNKIISSFRFYNSDEDFSLNGDGQAPYSYDIFTILLKEDNILIIGLPFKYLAKSLINDLLEKKQLLTKGAFVKTDLNKLIKRNEASDFTDDNFISYFSGVELTLTGDTNITSVNLDGDKPLESSLYKSVFLNLINEDQCKLERCSLKCETILDKDNMIPKTKSNVHVDLFGNYKFYIHGSGKNIFTIPFMFNLLSKYGCLETTLINPLIRLHDEHI